MENRERNKELDDLVTYDTPVGMRDAQDEEFAQESAPLLGDLTPSGEGNPIVTTPVGVRAEDDEEFAEDQAFPAFDGLSEGNDEPEVDPVGVRNDFDEEYAQELAPRSDLADKRVNRDEDDTADRGRGLGITSIILSVLSFFFLPYIMAPAGIIVGVISARRGSALGWWGVAVGIVAIILVTLAIPFLILF
ncbi:DUF4190 domain-containing protein [Hazenella coriacea]|uniref:DUF4190 domain-containing protein n=1 Tax=Hazenella coriacea TaxID=1179467 RepID=A0A4R3L6L6_9BACL|nr:DUF4190 domain-containing protein [Hazenella coriacea]TCS94718.1 hypothetical protein EDD58_103135 [Hazenella coriacea]